MRELTGRQFAQNDLPSLCNVIIAVTVFNGCSRLEVLGIESMITTEVVVVEECKVEVARKSFCALN